MKNNQNKSNYFNWFKTFNISFYLFILMISFQVTCEAENAASNLKVPPVPAPHSDFKIQMLKSLSQVFLISGLMSIFAEVSLRASMLNEFTKRTSVILESFFNKALDSSVRYGFVGISDSLDFAKLFSSTRTGDEVFWLDTYAPGHAQWLDIIEQKAKDGVKFKFLVIEPGCNEATLRSQEIGGRFESVFDHELRVFIFDLIRIANQVNSKTPNSIQIKMYNDLLALPFYIISKDNEPDFAATSFYLRKATGVTFPHLEWRDNDGGFVGVLKEYYEWKWGEAQEISDNYYQEILKGVGLPPNNSSLTNSPSQTSTDAKVES